MPKNVKKGKNTKAKPTQTDVRPLILRDEDQEYAKVVRILGNGRVEMDCYDNKTRLGIIRGAMRGRNKKRNLIIVGSIVLFSFRSYDDDKGDILHVYQPEEVRILRNKNEIPMDEQDAHDDIFYQEEEPEDLKIDEAFILAV